MSHSFIQLCIILLFSLSICESEIIRGPDLVKKYGLSSSLSLSETQSLANSSINGITTIPTIELPLIQGNYIEISISGNSYLLRIDFSLNDVYIFQEDEDAIFKKSKTLDCNKYTSECTDVLTISNVDTRQVVKIEVPPKYNECYTRKIRFDYDGAFGLGPTSFVWSLWKCVITLPTRIIFGPADFIEDIDKLTRFYDCTERSNLIVSPMNRRIDDVCVMMDKTLEYTQVSESVGMQIGTLKQGAFVDIERNGDTLFGFSATSLETKEYSSSVIRKVFETNNDLNDDVLILGRTAMISSIAIHLPSGISYYSYYPKSVYNEIINGDCGLLMTFILVLSVCYVFYTNYDSQLRHSSIFIKSNALVFNIVATFAVYFYIIVGIKPSICSIKNYDRCLVVYALHGILQVYYMAYIIWLSHAYTKISRDTVEFPCVCNPIRNKKLIHDPRNLVFNDANKLQKSSFSIMPQVCSLFLSIWFVVNFIDDSNLFVVGIGIVSIFLHNVAVIYMMFHIIYCLKLDKQEISPSLMFWFVSYLCSLFMLFSESHDYLELLSPLSSANMYTNILFSVTINISFGFLLSLKNIPQRIKKTIISPISTSSS